MLLYNVHCYQANLKCWNTQCKCYLYHSNGRTITFFCCRYLMLKIYTFSSTHRPDFYPNNNKTHSSKFISKPTAKEWTLGVFFSILNCLCRFECWQAQRPTVGYHTIYGDASTHTTQNTEKRTKNTTTMVPATAGFQWLQFLRWVRLLYGMWCRMILATLRCNFYWWN